MSNYTHFYLNGSRNTEGKQQLDDGLFSQRGLQKRYHSDSKNEANNRSVLLLKKYKIEFERKLLQR